MLGPELADLLHGADWREHQQREVREALESASMTFWVGETDGTVTGFVGARVVEPRRAIGEVYMVGVDPPAQRTGVGATLTRHAAAWLRDQGMRVACVSARQRPRTRRRPRLVQRLGYRALPGVQYFTAL